jgi:hypothetical protein
MGRMLLCLRIRGFVARSFLALFVRMPLMLFGFGSFKHLIVKLLYTNVCSCFGFSIKK